MKPVMQEFEHNPLEGKYGDCQRACVASLLELPIESVPHLYDAEDGAKMYAMWADWYKANGVQSVSFGFDQIPLEFMKSVNPNIHYILGGVNRDGIGHSVIAYNDEVVHDPSPVLTSDIQDWSHYWIEILSLPLERKR